MHRVKWKDGIEGIIIIFIGTFFFALALGIRKNSVSMDIPWVNILAQAKFMPLVMSSAILILGFILLVSQLKGEKKSEKLTRKEMKRIGVVIGSVSAYIVAVYLSNFILPTIIYLLGILLYLNWGKRKIWQIVAITILFVVISLVILPKIINLRLL